MSAMPKLEEPVNFGHRDGDFVHRELIVTPDITFDYEGPAEHPPDEAIPNIDITMQVTFRAQPTAPTAQSSNHGT
jgi:hypothetical protein